MAIWTITNPCIHPSASILWNTIRWLVVSTPLKNVSQLGCYSIPNIWKVSQNSMVPNHQPVRVCQSWISWMSSCKLGMEHSPIYPPVTSNVTAGSRWQVNSEKPVELKYQDMSSAKGIYHILKFVLSIPNVSSMVLEYAHQHLPKQFITLSCRFAYTSTMEHMGMATGNCQIATESTDSATTCLFESWATTCPWSILPQCQRLKWSKI